MKVLIVFFALFLVFVSAFVFQGDFNNYIRLENYLKNLAEECAIGACLYYDEASYGEGRFILNRTEGEAFVAHLIDESENKLRLSRTYNLTYKLELFDAEKGFLSEQNHNPSAQVTITYTTEDLFRLPFLRKTEITRQGNYEMTS